MAGYYLRIHNCFHGVDCFQLGLEDHQAKIMFKFHRACRACGNPELSSVLSLGLQPLANSFTEKDGEQSGYFPLNVLFCEKCKLAQLSIVVNPMVLYRTYNYETSKSAAMMSHFTSLWLAIQAQGKTESIIEIGSNDGEFLAFVRDVGAEWVVGIDAAENLAAAAQRRGITTVIGILDDDTAKCASQAAPKPDVIIARHVFCHADDWHKFMRSVDAMASRDTLVVIEVPYLGDTVESREFDQCYHEHLSYLSITAMTALLEPTPFRIQKVMRFPIHGGAIAVFIRRRDSDLGELDKSVGQFLAAERSGINWPLFRTIVKSKIESLKVRVDTWRRLGKKVIGYGASAKSTVWISACGFTRKDIAFVVDNTPYKQGKFSPGTDIPILPESAMTNDSADVAINFAWNFHATIIEKNKNWISQGGKFVNPHEP